MYIRLPKIWSQNAMTNDEVNFFEVRHHLVLEQDVAAAGIAVSTIAGLRRDLLPVSISSFIVTIMY